MKPILLSGIIFLALFLLVVVLNRSWANPENQAVQKITPVMAKQRLELDKALILVDVRTPQEYQDAHIPGSISIPLDVLENEAVTRLPDNTRPIIVYCASGRRSAAAAQILVKLGYRNVLDLGGLNDWPYETESGPPPKG